MQSFRILDGQARYLVAAVTLLVATLITAIMPIVAGAAQVTARSAALSNSSPTTTGVSYQFKFTPPSAAAEIVIDFCQNSPLIGATCTTPIVGFDASTATVAGFTKTAGKSSATRYVGTAGTITASTENTVTLTGVTNPTNPGTIYARVLTYAASGTDNYTDPTDIGTPTDEGGIAISIVPSIGVSAAVLETMTFCVSGEATEILDPGCTGTLTAPTLELGETVGTEKALSTGAVSTGSVYTQLSTNAIGGAVVNLKSNIACGGLQRFGASDCGIAAALPGDVTQFTDLTFGTAKFGVKLGTVQNAGSTYNGTLQAAATSSYDTTNYKMNWVNGNLTGVSSTYGDPILDTNNAPVNNKVMGLTFGASISDNTPAGKYSTTMNLVATGKF